MQKTQGYNRLTKGKRKRKMENSTFNYNYSAQRNREVENIRNKYLPREISKIELLRKLDFKVQSAGMLESLIIGVVGVLIFGIGMCFGLDVFGGADFLTVVFCLLGVIIMAPAYPIYRRIKNKTTEKLTPEILRLSDEIIKN